MSEQVQARSRGAKAREAVARPFRTIGRVLTGQFATSANALVDKIARKPKLLERIVNIVANEEIDFRRRKRFAEFLHAAAEQGVDVSKVARTLAPVIKDNDDMWGTLRKPLVFALHESIGKHGDEARERVDAAIPEFLRVYSAQIVNDFEVGAP